MIRWPALEHKPDPPLCPTCGSDDPAYLNVVLPDADICNDAFHQSATETPEEPA